MTDIPDWVAYASLGISAVSFIVPTVISAAALKVARRTARQAAPDVVGEFEVFEKSGTAPDDVAPVMICITARNRGLKTAHIEQFEMTNADKRGNFRYRFLLEDTAVLHEGSPLPVAIPEYRKVEWLYYVWELKLWQHETKPITDPRRIYKTFLLPYLRVHLEDGSIAIFDNRSGGQGAWLYETWLDWRDKRRQRALRARGSSKSSIQSRDTDESGSD